MLVAEELASRSLALQGAGTILVVEDQDRLRTVAARVLSECGYRVHEAASAFFRAALEDEGYEVVEAANGKEALGAVRSGSVDLVITDLVMPEQEGVETVRALRKEMPGIGIIAMSGGFGAHFLKVALAFGADAPHQQGRRCTAAAQSGASGSRRRGSGQNSY